MRRVVSILLTTALVLSLMATTCLQAFATEEENTLSDEVSAATESQTEPVPEDTESTEPTQPENTEFVASQECIDFIKEFEGFSKYPYWDYAQFTVGYGTRCPADKYDEYCARGITHEEAEALLREMMADFEATINRMIKKQNLTLTQNQFDALLSFTYNCGGAWTTSSGWSLHNAVVNDVDDAEFIRSISQTCTAGGQVLTSLIQRRLAEANIYLNGVYNKKPPANYCYVMFNVNGGSSEHRPHGYDADHGVAPYAVPEYEGYIFDGWYTERVGGTKVTALTAEHNGTTLYAHWVDSEGNPSFVQQGNVTVTVTGDGVNIRKGPGTNYAKAGKLYEGEKIVITETTTAGGYVWGKFTDGWVALQYTDYDTVIVQKPENDPENTEPTEPETTEPTEPETTEPTEPEEQPSDTTKVYGTVQVTTTLNVRSGPGTGYGVVGQLRANERVEILERKTVGSVTWGRISSGWISMSYVKLDTTSTEGNTGSTGNTATGPAYVGTGTVNVQNQLSIRSGPGTTYTKVGYLQSGAKVRFTKIETVGSVKWGKISMGWISLDYVILDNVSTDGTTATAVTGTVDVDDALRIRSGPGTTYPVSGYLYPGEKVSITEQKTVDGVKWGKISSGWICMDYVKLDSTGGTTGGTTDGTTSSKVIKGYANVAEFMNVRGGAGTSYDIVGKLTAKQTVSITELKINGTTVWGNIGTGWVSMNLIVITEDIRTVNATNLNVRTTPETGAVVASLPNGTQVSVLEYEIGEGRLWGRISQGWICLDYTEK